MDITDYVHRATLEMISRFNRELIETFKTVLDELDTPFEELTFDYDTMGITTAKFNGKPIIQWTSPVVETNPEGTSLTYKWQIFRVKESNETMPHPHKEEIPEQTSGRDGDHSHEK